MIFKKCPSCGKEVGPHNTHNIKIQDDGSALSGLYFTHSREDCHSTGFLPMKEVKARAEWSSGGNSDIQLEIDWYKERLKEVENGKSE